MCTLILELNLAERGERSIQVNAVCNSKTQVGATGNSLVLLHNLLPSCPLLSYLFPDFGPS